MNDLFLRACFGRPVERVPIWIMRQAGRYLPEYREVRKTHDFWTLCTTPELAARVTIQPVDRLGVDAAILFSDILVPLPAMGRAVAFRPAPEIEKPVRSAGEIRELRVPDPEKDLGHVLETIRILRRALAGRVPLIGFGGAPLTLAAYLVEGKGGGKFQAFHALFYEQPEAARLLIEHLARAEAEFLAAQIDAGAQAIQIFDSWAGILPRDLYQDFALEPTRGLVDSIRREGVPILYYARDAAHILDLLPRTGADVLSLDEKLPLSLAAERIGPGPALQGNLDNALLLGAPLEKIENAAARVLDDAPRDRGHVFNLGHGILPGTPVASAVHLVESVKRLGRRSDGVSENEKR
jgi:uroporphyrinogen decarboxylase